MIASDLNNPGFVGAMNPDAVLAVSFYKVAVQNQFETAKQGHPIFADRVMVRIMAPGNELNIVETYARDDHKARFPLQWAHYMNSQGGDAREIGTPVNQWPLLTPAQAEELKGRKFYTVEQLAGASDQQLQAIGMIVGTAAMTLRDKAKAYLQAAMDTALPQKQAEELAKRDLEIADLKASLARVAKQQDEFMAAQGMKQSEAAKAEPRPTLGVPKR